VRLQVAVAQLQKRNALIAGELAGTAAALSTLHATPHDVSRMTNVRRQVLTISLTVQSFRLPAIVPDGPRKLAGRSKQETNCNQWHARA
jgi:hypothetical protein